jgi:hypothetical protein
LFVFCIGTFSGEVETVLTSDAWQLFSSLLSQLIFHLLLSFSLSYFSLPKDALATIPTATACHTCHRLASSLLTLLGCPPILFPSLSFWTKLQVHICSPSSNRRPLLLPPWYLYGRCHHRNCYPYEMSLDYLLAKLLNHPLFSTALAKILGYSTRVCSIFDLSLTLHFLDSDSDVLFFIYWQRSI